MESGWCRRRRLKNISRCMLRLITRTSLTFIGIRGVDVQIEVLAVAESRDAHDLALYFKNGQTGAIEVDLQGVLARLEAKEDGRRHVGFGRMQSVSPESAGAVGTVEVWYNRPDRFESGRKQYFFLVVVEVQLCTYTGKGKVVYR